LSARSPSTTKVSPSCAWRERPSNSAITSVNWKNLKLTQGEERYQERSRQIDGELAEIAAQQAQERATQAAAEANLDRRQGEIDALYRKLESTQKDGDTAELELEAQRQAVVQAERELQEAGYSEKIV